jgi:hypothetical protein
MWSAEIGVARRGFRSLPLQTSSLDKPACSSVRVRVRVRAVP